MDASFAELVLLFVIGLLVLGPERLPKVARKIGHFIGYARRMSRNLQQQIEDELELEELRKSLPERVDLKRELGLDELERDVRGAIDPDDADGGQRGSVTGSAAATARGATAIPATTAAEPATAPTAAVDADAAQPAEGGGTEAANPPAETQGAGDADTAEPATVAPDPDLAAAGGSEADDEAAEELVRKAASDQHA